jgi:hypothetical protein
MPNLKCLSLISAFYSLLGRVLRSRYAQQFYHGSGVLLGILRVEVDEITSLVYHDLSDRIYRAREKDGNATLWSVLPVPDYFIAKRVNCCKRHILERELESRVCFTAPRVGNCRK